MLFLEVKATSVNSVKGKIITIFLMSMTFSVQHRDLV